MNGNNDHHKIICSRILGDKFTKIKYTLGQKYYENGKYINQIEKMIMRNFVSQNLNKN